MTKDTSPIGLQDAELDSANGGFRLEHDTNVVVAKGKNGQPKGESADTRNISMADYWQW